MLLWCAIDVVINIHSYKHLKEGDLVFHYSKSEQSPLIFAAQLSPWTHCGVVVERKDGLYVFEAVGPSKLTPFEEWRKRGHFDYVVTHRVKKEPMKIETAALSGLPYDRAFKFNNGKLYCSELIYELYRDQFGIELGMPKAVKKYHFMWLSVVKRTAQRRKISLEQKAIAPVDVLRSKHCKRIFGLL